MTFHSVGNVIIPTDLNSIIFQDGYCTTNQIMLPQLLILDQQETIDFPMKYGVFL